MAGDSKLRIHSGGIPAELKTLKKGQKINITFQQTREVCSCYEWTDG